MHDTSFGRLVGWAVAGAAFTGSFFLTRRLREGDRESQMERSLIARAGEEALPAKPDFSALPEPAQRYLRHALGSEGLHKGAICLSMTGRMMPKEGARKIGLAADELLALPHGFIWTAHLRMNGLSVRVRDYFLDGQGGIGVELFSLIPIQSSSGLDVTRSSRHRLAAEAVWCPTALLPGPNVRWESVDSMHVRSIVTIEGEEIPLTLTIDDVGRLNEVTMLRWGNVGVEAWQLIPYGFSIDAEATFNGITIPSRLSGGWWYGTDRFEAANAAEFTILDARPASDSLSSSNAIEIHTVN